MGLLEELARRNQLLPPALAFPDWIPPAPEDPNVARLPRLSDLPQTLLPPHLRNRTVAPDAAVPAIQSALGDIPPGPGIPANFRIHTGAGLLPPGVLQGAGMPMMEPLDTAAITQPAVPMPTARPADAPPPVYPDDGASPAPPSLFAPPATDVGARSRTPAPAPLPIAPISPAPASAAPPAAPSAGLLGTGSVLDRVGNFLSDNSNTLLALGAGFAGAPNLGQGISRAAAAAIPARAADINQTIARQSRGVTTKALIDAGVPIQQAVAASVDPELKKSLIQSYITDRGKDVVMIKTKDPWGGETEVPYIKNKFPKEGEPVLTPAFTDAGGAAAPVPGTNGANPSGTPIYAPGINQTNFDHSKVGEEYIQQFSPAMQSDVKAYLEGRSIPTGKSSQAQVIKQVAKKYGDDIGMPADDALITQRKEWAKSLADTKSGVGLSSKGFKQGLEHFVGLSDNLVKMNLSNGFGLEPVAGAINTMKNLTTEQKRLVNKNDVFGQALSREMGNLFAKNGGGVHEAAETKKNISNSTASSTAAAGSLEAIDELMQGGLRTLQNRRDELFPNGTAPRGSEFLGPEQQKQLEHIRRNIAILKGEKPAAEATPSGRAPAVAAPAPGTYVWDAATGKLVPAK